MSHASTADAGSLAMVIHGPISSPCSGGTGVDGQVGPRSTTVPPFHRTPRICPDLTSWIGSGGVPGPELTRRFGFFTTFRHRCRRSSSPPAPYTWLKKLVSTPESTDPLQIGH